MLVYVIDADIIANKKHRFPNLASMKISGWHKAHGDTVELKLDYDHLELADKVYISKVFTDTYVDESVLSMSNVQYGGTGFYYDNAPPLEYDIEHSMPDYHLYDEFVKLKTSSEGGAENPKHFDYYTNHSIGFTTRGCIRQCSFCVNRNKTKCVLHSPVSEFLDPTRKYICLLDDNVFACPQWKTVFEQLKDTGKIVQYKQGLDERLLTDEKCEWLFKKLMWIGDYIFAFDRYSDKEIIEPKLSMIRKYTSRNIKFYTFCGYNHESDVYDEQFWIKDICELFERIYILMKYKCLPYIMRHKNYLNSPYKSLYCNIARWCNQPHLMKTKTFREFCNIENHSRNCIARFESAHKDVADKYFDVRFEDLNIYKNRR